MAESEQDKSFVEIYNATYDRILKYVVLKSGNATDASDIVQNTYILFYSMQRKKQNIEKPVDYLFKIAKNEINKYYLTKEKRLREIPVFSESGDEGWASPAELEHLLSEELSADRYIDLQEIWKYIERQDVLTMKIFVLYFRFDEKLTDIAQELDISESNVKNRLYRTIKRLQKEFGFEIQKAL